MTTRVSTVSSEGLRIFKNSMILGIGDVAIMGLGFVTTILVTDQLGQDYGLFIAAQRFVGLFLVVAQFGLGALLIRAVARREDDVGGLLGTVLFLRSVLGVAFGVLVMSTAYAMGYLAEHRWLLAVFALLEFTGVMVETFVGTCQGLETMGRATVIRLSRSVITCVGVLVVLFTGGGLYEVAIVYLVSRVIQLLIAVVVTHGAVPELKLHVRWDRLRAVVSEARLFLLVKFGYAALRALDVVMLTQLQPDKAEVARYGAALNFLDVLLTMPLLVQRALLPAFSRLHAEGGVSGVGRNSLQIASAVLLPAAVGVALLSEHAVALYPSGQFADAAIVLTILASGFYFVAMETVAATLLTGAGRVNIVVKAYIPALTCQVATNFALAPSFGAVGIAISTVATYAVLAFIYLFSLKKVDVPVPFGAMARHGLASAIMCPFILATRQYVLPVPIAAGMLGYLVGLLLVTRPGSLERRMMNELLAKMRRMLNRGGD